MNNIEIQLPQKLVQVTELKSLLKIYNRIELISQHNSTICNNVIIIQPYVWIDKSDDSAYFSELMNRIKVAMFSKGYLRYDYLLERALSALKQRKSKIISYKTFKSLKEFNEMYPYSDVGLNEKLIKLFDRLNIEL